jgi:glycosyltransferase involved in cell wall biosynthesis
MTLVLKSVLKKSDPRLLKKISEPDDLNRLNDLNNLNSFKSMNVLLITGIFPPDIGGPATYVPAISSELVKRGHKITVVTLSDALSQDDHSYPFEIVRIQRGIFKLWRFVLTVAAILRNGRRAHVLYVNGLQLETVIANFFLHKPLVQKLVGDWAWERATNKGWVTDGFEEFQTRRHNPKVELLKVLRRFCACRADTVIVPSRYLARAVANWGVSESKTIVIYNAIELHEHAPATVPLSTQFKVVTVGRLVPWKQIDHLIESLTECEAAGLVIVGDGPERNRLEEIVRENQLTDRVYFAGQRSKEETLALMAACDLFVLNSTYEGFPHVVVEAMTAGLPVVATAVGGTPELVRDGENGQLIAPDANGVLSKTLMKLLSSSEERQRLATGAKRTVERFRHSAMVEETEALLRASAL